MNRLARIAAARFVVAAIAVAACLAAASPANGATPGIDPVPPPSAGPSTGGALPPPTVDGSTVDGSTVDPGAAAALAAGRGISVAEATKRLGRQKSLGDTGARVETALRGASGGSYLDADGALVVTTLDPAGDAAAAAAGARPQRVTRSAAKLNAIVKRLDTAAAGGAGGVQGWYVDVPTNTVVVTVTDGATDPKTAKLTALAKTFGQSVRFESRPATEQPKQTEFMVGGFAFEPGCSVGFNAVDAANRNVVVTAGHCLTTRPTTSRSGFIIGATRTVNYPVDDFGTFWNSYPGYWQPSPSVYKWNNTYLTVHGSWAAPVGATVCKSGRTTGWTCGTIRALNETVSYGGQIVNGLTRHTACVERGDSGGANISTGGFALGLTSGASLPASGKCLSKTGQENRSWYQPIGEALSRNGLRLLTA